jgi:hypothetical protein
MEAPGAGSPLFYNHCLKIIKETLKERKIEPTGDEEITATLYNYESWIYISARVFSELINAGVSFKKDADSASMRIIYKANPLLTKNTNLYAILSACRNSAAVDIHGFIAPFIMFSPHAAITELSPIKLDSDIQQFAKSGRVIGLNILQDGFIVLVRERFADSLRMHCFASQPETVSKNVYFNGIHKVASMSSSLVHALYVISSRHAAETNEKQWISTIHTPNPPLIEHTETLIAISAFIGMDMRPLFSNKTLVSDANF